MDTGHALNRAVAALPTVSVQDRFYRFIAEKRREQAFNGSNRGGRWGPPNAFRVLYLSDSYDGCVIEAYRHSVDLTDDPLRPPVRLGLVACDIDVTNILDLTTATARSHLGLDPSILFSEPQEPDGAAYQACSMIAQIAHQIGLHGIYAPAATNRGHTLALFPDRLPDAGKPRPVGGKVTWEALPADPRTLRIVRHETR